MQLLLYNNKINIGLITILQQQPQKFSKKEAMNQSPPGHSQHPSSPKTKYRNRRLYKPPPAQDNSSNFLKLAIVILISFVFIAGQFLGGIISHSISVISDAFHLVTDLIGFVVAFVFIYYTKKGPNDRMSFGYHRMELLGALGNLFIIWALSIFLLYQATTRIINKEFVREPKIMLLVAVVGLPINIIMYFVLHGSSHSHGLMSEECGSEYSVSIHGNDDEPCHGALCKDYSCQAYNQIGEHCHRKVGEELEIHKHNKEIVNQQIINGYMNLQNNNIQQHVHNTHQGHNHQGHNHDHDHAHDHDNDHGHDHAGHSHSHAGHSHDHGGHSHQNMSMKAAVLHALSDIIQSIGLIISALIIFFFGSGHDVGSQVTQWNDWHYVDPITTYIFCIIVFISTAPITKNCYHIIMESTPGHISIKEIQQEFLKIKGVSDVHDLHVWDLRPGKTILIAHVFSEKNQETHVLKKLTDFCRKKRIYHSTFQVEEQQLRHNEEYILCDHDIH